jgi:DivIVA domain-containing protein
MFAVEVLVAVVVLVGVALVAGGSFDPMSDENVDRRDIGLPSGRQLRSDDVPRLRFGLALRGYRMSDVDAAMAQVYDALTAAEAAAGERSVGPAVATTASEPPMQPPQPPSPPAPVEPTPPPPPAPPPMQPEPLPRPEPPLAQQPSVVQPTAYPSPSSTQLPVAPEPVAPDPAAATQPPVGEPPPGEAAEQPPADAESQSLSTLERLRRGDDSDL